LSCGNEAMRINLDHVKDGGTRGLLVLRSKGENLVGRWVNNLGKKTRQGGTEDIDKSKIYKERGTKEGSREKIQNGNRKGVPWWAVRKL